MNLDVKEDLGNKNVKILQPEFKSLGKNNKFDKNLEKLSFLTYYPLKAMASKVISSDWGTLATKEFTSVKDSVMMVSTEMLIR